jgi:hypothetical protein
LKKPDMRKNNNIGVGQEAHIQIHFLTQAKSYLKSTYQCLWIKCCEQGR